MNLILWRHAEAEDIAPDHTDEGRRLTAHGEKQAERMAAWLTRHMPEQTRVLVSPAVRTRQTAAPLKRKDIEIEARLFTDASVQDQLAVLADHGASADLLLVGHQPTLGQLAAYLLCGEVQPWTIKKGAAWWLRLGPDEDTRIVCVQDTRLL